MQFFFQLSHFLFDDSTIEEIIEKLNNSTSLSKNLTEVESNLVQNRKKVARDVFSKNKQLKQKFDQNKFNPNFSNIHLDDMMKW